MDEMQAARVLPPHIDEARPRPVVRGTDIKVSQIAFEYEHHGMSPDQIIEAHSHLTLADVHAALAYFYDHLEAIRADWRETDRIVEEMRKKFSSGSRPHPPRAS